MKTETEYLKLPSGGSHEKSQYRTDYEAGWICGRDVGYDRGLHRGYAVGFIVAVAAMGAFSYAVWLTT